MFLLSSFSRLVGRVYSFILMPRQIVCGKRCVLSYCDGHSIKGKSNYLEFDDDSQLNHCRFIIKGNLNRVIVGKRCRLSGVTFWISGERNEIILGDDTTVGKNTQFATLEGTRIIVGKDCMFSHNIQLRTSDSHSIVNEDGKRTNYAEDIVIGDHCWIGLDCLILKGSLLADNTVLAARSILTKKFDESGCIVGGSPAKTLTKNINWDRKRL